MGRIGRSVRNFALATSITKVIDKLPRQMPDQDRYLAATSTLVKEN